MAHCDEYIELISAAMDGALSSDDRARLDGHLARCPRCAALMKELEAVHQELSALPRVQPPAELPDRIMAAVEADKVLPLAPKGSAFRWKRWAASAAAVVLIFAGAWGMRGRVTLGGGASRSADASGTWASVQGTETVENAAVDKAPEDPAPTEVQVASEEAPAPMEVQAASEDAPAGPLTEAQKDAEQAKTAVTQAEAAAQAQVFDANGDLSPLTKSVGPQAAFALPSAQPGQENTEAGEETGGGDNGAPASEPSAPGRSAPLRSTAPETAEESGSPASGTNGLSPEATPAIQPFQAMIARLPAGEAELPPPATVDEAAWVLANYLYELVDTVELVSQEDPKVYAISGPTGASGTLTHTGEDESAFRFDYQDSEGGDALRYAVSKADGTVDRQEEEAADGAVAADGDY